MYKISDAARRAALTVKTVRYYAESDIAKLGSIGRARRYSFSIE
jgi:DNA-binding transcriptional MerR regulator